MDKSSKSQNVHKTVNIDTNSVQVNSGETGNITQDTTTIEPNEPEDELAVLDTWSVDQDKLEKDVAREADQALIERENELDEKRLTKSLANKAKFTQALERLEERLYDNIKISEKEKIRKEINKLQDIQLKNIDQDIKEIKERMKERNEKSQIIPSTAKASSTGSENEPQKNAGETEHEFLVRTGKITPFANTFMGATGSNTILETSKSSMSHQQLRLPGMELDQLSEEEKSDSTNEEQEIESDVGSEPEVTQISRRGKKRKADQDDADYDLDDDEEDYEEDYENDSDKEIDEYQLSDVDTSSKQKKTKKKKSSAKKKKTEDAATEELKKIDDGDINIYNSRLESWLRKRKLYREKMSRKNEDLVDNEEAMEEWLKPHPLHGEFKLNDKFKMPGDIYTSLFDYQKTCIQWQWELYCQNVGGIIGDEMGLGKTIQIVSFIAGLHYSGLLKKPVLIVCPATVMNQWVNEFHRWWPPLRVCILHSIGSGMDLKHEESLEETLANSEQGKVSLNSINKLKGAKSIVDSVSRVGHVIITTYVGLRIYSNLLLPKKWGYCVLDEGHKIRNPNSDISLAAKGVKTTHRIILSGTPIQNNLTELWSLFDFVFPGRLGTLPVFQSEFSIPIKLGGYANATNVQVQTAYKCAVVLRDLISPYLLRRMKVDVAADLPKKTEKVLFCKLTQIQRDNYVKFLQSPDLKSIFEGKRKALFGIDILRKICNHPDLVERDILMHKKGYNYGAPEKSGKMQVVKALIELWKSQGHRSLLFCQTRQTMDILNRMIRGLDNFKFLVMDGTTPIGQRQTLVDQFNDDTSIDLFLLTTRVGGLGVNLTGANRVIIFDPDWNPSTDVQARERAWRLGQTKDVFIYRLLTAGTIEEKIYHRQIFKQFLTNKILQDPKQRRFFKMNDLHDLFTLDDGDDRSTETGRLFSGTERKIQSSSPSESEQEHNKSKSTAITSKKREQLKRENEDDFMQVASMSGVAGLEDFRDGDNENDGSDTKNNDENQDEDDRLITGLFSNSGVYSTLQHDSIMEGSHPDKVIIEREASRVAKQAAEALKQSRKLTRRAQIGVPTWTGKFGAAGKTGGIHRETPSPASRSRTSSPSPAISSSGTPISTGIRSRLFSKSNDSTTSSSFNLLKNLREKRALELSASGPDINPEEKAPKSDEQKLESMRNYLLNSENHQAPSKDILMNCGMSLSGVQEVSNVRQMLKEIAIWNGSKKVWKLKEEFE